jgi:hypothetical protein
MASENIGPIYTTQIPGYEDSADIQAALKLYHYGTTTVPTQESQIVPNSVAGHIKALDTRVDTIEALGVGSSYTDIEPASPVEGFIWVKSDSTVPQFNVPTWKLIDSGNLSGTSFSVSNIAGEKIYLILKDWGHSNTGEDVGLVVKFNSDSGPNYVNTGGLTSASGLYSPEFPNTTTQDLTVEIDLANTAAGLKPVATIADTSAGPYFGYYRNTNEITSVQVTLSSTGSFDTGSYQVWSYE